MTQELLAPGTRIDRYVIEKHLGSGGAGSVYRARHASIGQLVCIKVLKASAATDAQAAQRFLREAQLAAATGSRNIIQVHDFATTDDGQPFIVMEHLDGCDLGVMIEREKKLPVPRAMSIALQILDAVDAAHRKQILHRDLKPGNVFLVTGPDGDEMVKLLDFGIGKVVGDASAEQLTRTGMLMGTPLYMAPEQFAGAENVGPRGDLYSVAVIIYEMLSGQLPHTGDTLTELLTRITSEQPVPLGVLEPGLPPGLTAVIERGLSKDPEARHGSAHEMAAALRASVDDGATAKTIETSAVPMTLAHRPDPMMGPSVKLAPGAPAATTTTDGAKLAVVGASVVTLVIVGGTVVVGVGALALLLFLLF